METAKEFLASKPYGKFLALSSGWTRQAYTQNLRMFKNFLDRRGLDPFQVDRQIVLEFREELTKPGLTPSGKIHAPYSASTMIHALATVSKFYKYLFALGLIRENPASILSFMRIRKPERLPRALSPMDRLSILNATQSRGRRPLKMSLATLLAFHCGLRISELAGIVLRNMDFMQKTVRVVGKGDKEREIPLTIQAIGLCERFLALRLHPDSPFLFPNEKDPLNRHSKPQIINGWIKTVGAWAGIENLTCHVLRHTFGTQLAETGAKSWEIRDLMGHATILQAEAYIKIAAEMPREAHARAFNQTKEVSDGQYSSIRQAAAAG